MIRFDVDTKGLDSSQRFLAGLKGQLPFATSLALNQTARDVQLAYKAETTSAFQAPVAFTRNAFRYNKSNKASLVAEVFPLPDRPYLDTQSFGGQRRWKAYEGFIRGLAASSGKPLPPGKLLPTSVAINAAGNPKRSLFSQLQSRLSTKDRGGFFIGTPRGNTNSRSAGVYRRSREKLIPFFLVSDSEPQYKPRFPFERLGNSTVARVFPSRLSAAIDRAVRTAR
ncbi:MAG: hypothetical protein ACO3GP_04150 [Candidatus Limnocylindrus sp.]